MKNLLASLTLLVLSVAQTNAQQNKKTPDDLFGYYIGKMEATVIDFKRHHKCEIKTLVKNVEVEKQEATWQMNEKGNLVFSDRNGKLLFELENQKGSWYERDKSRDYTFKMIYVSVKEIKKPKAGQGC